MLVWIEKFDLSLDHLPDVVRHSKFDLVDVNAQVPTAGGTRDNQSRLQKVVDGIHHKQRVAIGALVYQRRQLGRKLVTREPDGQIIFGRRGGEVFEWHFLAQLLCEQLLLYRFQRMTTDVEFDIAIRSEQHQVSGPALRGQIRDEIERRVIAPVQIF